jgi:hypothetical protein
MKRKLEGRSLSGLFCIPKTTRWASGSKEAAADEEK